MANNEYDLTFKKFSELEAGSGAAAVGDKFIMSDVSDSNKVVTRTIQDIVNLSDTNVTARTAYVVVSLVELNAGKVLIPAVIGKQIVINDITVRCSGSFGDLTTAVIESIHASPTAIFTMAQANMTNNAVLFKGATGVTLGDGFGTSLTTGQGVRIVKTGEPATTATGMFVSINYFLRTP